MALPSTVDILLKSKKNTTNGQASVVSAADHIYIGKIPAYNDKLTQKIQYQERLKNNLTITTFSPTGYSINLMTSTDENVSTTSNDVAKTIYKMGGSLSNKVKVQDKVIETSTALDNWLSMQGALMRNNDIYMSPFKNACKTFSIIATNDSTINETISNDYAPNKLGDVPSMLGSILGSGVKNKMDALKNTAQFAASGMTSVDSMAMINMLRTKDGLTGDNQFFSLLASQAIGIQSALPKIWQRSDYNNTSSFTIKLVSPSGHPKDVERFVIDPLLRLILAASPITYDGVSYGYPPIWKVEARGLLNINLAAITAIVISRGGQDTLFNRHNQPTNIDVRLTVEPLVNGFASPLTNNKTYNPNPGSGLVDMLVANPMAITDTMNRTDTTSTKSFQLNTLVLGD